MGYEHPFLGGLILIVLTLILISILIDINYYQTIIKGLIIIIIKGGWGDKYDNNSGFWGIINLITTSLKLH